MKMNVLIACGGTGGHLFPGIAIAEALIKAGHKPLLLISEKKVDAQASEKYGILDFITVPAIAKPSTLSLKMIPFILRLWKSINQSKKLLKENDIHVVLGMGGFTSLPPIYAGKKLKLPTFVHDSNALPGKANRLTARWCKKVLIGLEAARKHFKHKNIELTGTPVRAELTASVRQDRARASFKLPSDGKNILIMGGSQGAKHLNTLIVETAKSINQSGNSQQISFIHITGNADYERISDLTKDIEGYRVIAFCSDMTTAYSACDIVLCRAGASSMTELAYLGKPSILVPYPYAADDHQTINAQVFQQAEAALLRQESELSAEQLISDLTQLATRPDICEKMSKNAESLSVKDSADQIANIITSP